MKKLLLLLIVICLATPSLFAQKAAKAFYAELGGPGLASINYDMRFKKEEAGFGFRVGVGGFSISDNFDNSKAGVILVPVGLNYLIGKDQKNYFEVGAGFTYLAGNAKDDFNSETFSTSFGNLTLGYRLAPAKGGFFFKAQMTPVFGKGFFVPYWAGIAFGYKF
jgi:hypothetical protein